MDKHNRQKKSVKGVERGVGESLRVIDVNDSCRLSISIENGTKQLFKKIEHQSLILKFQKKLEEGF